MLVGRRERIRDSVAGRERQRDQERPKDSVAGRERERESEIKKGQCLIEIKKGKRGKEGK